MCNYKLLCKKASVFGQVFQLGRMTVLRSAGWFSLNMAVRNIQLYVCFISPSLSHALAF